MRMTASVSENTKAILLLTAPLIVGKGIGADKPLTLSKYNGIARHLKHLNREPANLVGEERGVVLRELQLELEFELGPIKRLLDRGFLLSQAIDYWQQRAIWVMSRADAEYPQRLKERLGSNAPAVLYGCGNRELLDNGGLAVVGSRNAANELLEYTKNVGRLVAESGCTIVSGAARGVDQAAMLGALRRGGTVVGVLPGNLEREALNAKHREMLIEGNLVLISPNDPKARFSVGNAMARNKLIYALADAGLVIESGYGKGGTWTGAVEQLDRLRLLTVYTRSRGEISPGLKGLRCKGAFAWPNPETPQDLNALLSNRPLRSLSADTSQLRLIPDSAKDSGADGTKRLEQETSSS